MKRFVVRLGVAVVVASVFATYSYARKQDPEKKLSAMLAKCNASLTRLSSVERDPCRFICSDTSDKVLWVQPLAESVCDGLR